MVIPVGGVGTRSLINMLYHIYLYVNNKYLLFSN